MYKSIFLILCAFLAFPAFAQPAGFKAVKDLDAFNSRFALESGKVISIKSDFRQEKDLTALAEKITSTGKFWFKRSNLVRIDYEKPFIYRLIINGDKVLLKDEQKENRVNVKSNKLFQQVNKIMLDCIQGTILNSKDFTSKVFESENSFLMEMTPVEKNLKQFFSMIRLYVAKGDYSVNQIEMHEPGGDKTILFFTNKQLNQNFSDEIFAL
jgi:outer membrane lipoprotein-sorting protein